MTKQGIGLGWRMALAAGLLALAACAPLPRYTTLPVETRPSPNFSERRPNYVILHHTTNDSAEQAVATLTSRMREVSAHYLITRDGRIIYLVDELKRAWHAGDSYWGGNRDLNSSSIGIELDNNGNEPFPDAQIDALIALLGDLSQRWNIPAANVLGPSVSTSFGNASIARLTGLKMSTLNMAPHSDRSRTAFFNHPISAPTIKLTIYLDYILLVKAHIPGLVYLWSRFLLNW